MRPMRRHDRRLLPLSLLLRRLVLLRRRLVLRSCLIRVAAAHVGRRQLSRRDPVVALLLLSSRRRLLAVPSLVAAMASVGGVVPFLYESRVRLLLLLRHHVTAPSLAPLLLRLPRARACSGVVGVVGRVGLDGTALARVAQHSGRLLPLRHRLARGPGRPRRALGRDKRHLSARIAPRLGSTLPRNARRRRRHRRQLLLLLLCLLVVFHGHHLAKPIALEVTADRRLACSPPMLLLRRRLPRLARPDRHELTELVAPHRALLRVGEWGVHAQGGGF